MTDQPQQPEQPEATFEERVDPGLCSFSWPLPEGTLYLCGPADFCLAALAELIGKARGPRRRITAADIPGVIHEIPPD